jgi:hypothetical protein
VWARSTSPLSLHAYDGEKSRCSSPICKGVWERDDGQREGDLCTINGFPGHLHRDANGRLTCVPDVRRDGMQDERQAAYAECTRTLENSRRNP